MRDPVEDFLNYDAKVEEENAKYPVCVSCGNRITDETFYEIAGEILCEDCMNESYRRFTDDYITEKDGDYEYL